MERSSPSLDADRRGEMEVDTPKPFGVFLIEY